MRRSGWIWIAAASLALAPATALAADVEAQLEAMQSKLDQLEQRLDATTDELDAANRKVDEQADLIRSSGIADANGASSGLASFLESIEMGGWLAVSYLYNFNYPSDNDGGLAGANAASGGNIYPFHPDANSFEVDQLWFEIEKPVSPDDRAGFRADLVYGKTADILSDFSQDCDGFADSAGCGGSQDDLQIYQAYVQYLAPVNIGDGVLFKAGKFATLMGAEVAQSPYNFNITRGNIYNLFQPFTHTGVLASVENGGATFSLGATNSNTYSIDVDNNDDKSVIGQIGYATETWGAYLNGLWGGFQDGSSSQDEAILGTVLTWDPTEDFSAWLNANYRSFEEVEDPDNPGRLIDANGWGVAVAGQYAFTEKTTFALRGEYVYDTDGFIMGYGDGAYLWSVTGTLGYYLTEKLLLRGEVRWDTLSSGDPDNDIFIGSGDDGFAAAKLNDDQIVGAVEVIYNF